MISAVGNRKTVLVTDAERGSALAIIRSLGRAGWKVIAADSHDRSLGFRSRYVRNSCVYPSPLREPQAFAQCIRQAATTFHVDLVIPVTANCILPLNAARSDFPSHCKLALPAPDAWEVTRDKSKTLELATRLGVPIPRTHCVATTREALEYAASTNWPIVLKPLASQSLQNGQVCAFPVRYASDRQSLKKEMQRFEGQCEVLLQEFTPGVGVGVELLMNQGRPLAAFQHARIREVPVSGGASAFRQSVPIDPELYRHATRLLGELQWTGLAMVEFKQGARSTLMEINGRVWGSLPLAIRSGMDFPAMWANIYTEDWPRDREPAVNTNYRIGVRSRNLELDLMWILTVLLGRGRSRYPFLPSPGRSQAVRALLGMLNPTSHFDILSLEDPAPGFAELFKIARKFSSKWNGAEAVA